MLLDQLEYVSSDGAGADELFQITSSSTHAIVKVDKAKEFIVGFWKKFESEGRIGMFRVVPMRFK
jgi:hypothetical protein